MKWFYLFLLSHAPPWSPLRETNALTYPTSLLRLLTCHTHDYQYWQWSRTCACPWGCCAEGRMRWRRGGSCPPVWLYLSQRPSCWCDCIYENTRGGVQVMSRVRVQGAWKNHLRVHAFMLRGPALFFPFLREADRLPVFVRFSVEAASSQTGEGRRKAETEGVYFQHKTYSEGKTTTAIPFVL